jgi:hypothetical protein
MVVVVVKRIERQIVQASTGVADVVEKSGKFWPAFMN